MNSDSSSGKRFCEWCNGPLDNNAALSRRYHPDCQVEHRAEEVREWQRKYQKRKRAGLISKDKRHCKLENVGMDYVQLRLRGYINEQ